jgi:hypothetical protein
MGDKPKFDFGPELDNLAGLFNEVVQDTTDPQFLAFLTDLATDSVEIAALHASGADPVLVNRAEEAVLARAQSLANTPGLVVASNIPSFIEISRGFVRTGANVLAGVLRYYMPIAPMPTT